MCLLFLGPPPKKKIDRKGKHASCFYVGRPLKPPKRLPKKYVYIYIYIKLTHIIEFTGILPEVTHTKLLIRISMCCPCTAHKTCQESRASGICETPAALAPEILRCSCGLGSFYLGSSSICETLLRVCSCTHQNRQIAW